MVRELISLQIVDTRASEEANKYWNEKLKGGNIVMTVDDVAEIGEETHIWKNDKLIFEGKYYRNNLFSKEKVYGSGYEEEIGSEPPKWWCLIILE